MRITQMVLVVGLIGIGAFAFLACRTAEGRPACSRCIPFGPDTWMVSYSSIRGEATAQAVRVQYGGSVTTDNIATYMAMPEVDGALVGGASLKPGFVELVRRAAQVT